MKPRSARWLAWSIVSIFFIFTSIGLVFQYVTGKYYTNMGFPLLVSMTLFAWMWVVTGAMIISRHPQHPVGWLMCLGVSAAALDMLAYGYVVYDGFAFPGTLPGLNLALIWLVVSGFPFATTAFTLMFLLFPDGRPASPGWQKMIWLALGTLFVYLPLQAVKPGAIDPYSGIYLSNPIGVDVQVWTYLEPLLWLANLMLGFCNLAAVYSLFYRLRHSKGEIRQQLKWLVLPAGLYLISIPFIAISLIVENWLFMGIGLFLAVPAILGVLITTAFAIFRYRLYDVDLIIRRTLAYSLLTALLTLLYFSGVVFLQNVLTPGFGLWSLSKESPEDQTSQVAVVLSTLMIAALFTPLRLRIQAFIDRRFYRQKYNAEEAFAEFAEVTRRETDLIHLTGLLTETVQETLQPELLSLWLVTVRD